MFFWKKTNPNTCQMLAVFWYMISNHFKWPRRLMCPGVKQGCPDQPLTPGSFIRLCSRHGSIDKGHWKGHRLSLFTSIQLKHQQLNRAWCSLEHQLCSVIGNQFNKVSTERHIFNGVSFFSSTSHSFVSSDVMAPNMVGNKVSTKSCVRHWLQSIFAAFLFAVLLL